MTQWLVFKDNKQNNVLTNTINFFQHSKKKQKHPHLGMSQYQYRIGVLVLVLVLVGIGGIGIVTSLPTLSAIFIPIS